MRRLVPPYKPPEPIKPNEFIVYNKDFVIYDGEELSLGDIAERLPPEVQINDLKFVGRYIEDFDNPIFITYKVKVKNPYFKSEMDSYTTTMEKYAAKLAKYKEKHKVYLEEKKLCDVEVSKKLITNKEKQIAKLTKRLKELQK